MATFAPNVQENPAYPLQSDQSRPIETPRTDTSKELLLKGLGNIGGEAVGLAGEFVEGNIRNELHTGIDDINNQALSRLSEAKVNPSLIDKENTQPIPAGLDNLDHKLDTLDMARRGNKYSQTYIDAQRDTLLKQVRSDHPGFRDYIDETNAKYTREDPANKYISSLIGDINSYQVAQNDKRTKDEAQIWKGINAGWDNAPDILNAYKNGKLGKNPGEAIADWSYKNTRQDYERKKAMDDMAINKDNVEKERQAGETAVTAEAGRQVTNTLDNIYLTSGVKAQDYPQRVLNGEAQTYSGAQLEQIGDTVLQKKALAQASFMKWASTVDPSTGKSPMQVVNPTRLNEIWGEQAKRFDDTAELYKNKDFGLAYAAHRIDDALERGQDHSLASNPRTANVWNSGKLIAHMGPGFGAEVGKALMEEKDPKTGKSPLSSFHDYFTTDVLNAVAQPSANPVQPDGKPFTVNEGITQAQTNLKEPDAVSAYAKGTLNLVDKISDPKYPDQAKHNLAAFAFDPSNAGLLDKFSKDNQADVYGRLYSYGNIKEVHKLAQADPQLWNNFKTTAYNHFGSSLLHTQLMDLNEIPSNPNLSVSWNTETHQFRVDQWPKTGKFSPQENALITGDYLKAKKSIDAINVGLTSISGISKIEHRDANVDALQFLLSAGVSKGSLPHSMLDAVANSKRRPTFKDTDEQ